MKPKRIALALLAALAVASAAPFLSADRFQARIHSALEASLGRRVEIAGKVRFSLWNGPGFSLADVVIHEDPAIGIEPFAYVSSLAVQLDWIDMLRGKWKVSRIVLSEPTVNLARQPTGTWNVKPLLVPAERAGMDQLPAISVRGGRLNLKFSDVKSVLYGSNADLDVTPRAAGQWQIRFSLEPARTDRTAQSLGTLRGQGVFRWKAQGASELDADIELERSAIFEIATLLEGRGGALRGFLASRAKLQGPLNGLQITGTARLEDIQSWDLFGTGSSVGSIQYRGLLRLPPLDLDLETAPVGKAAPFRLRLRGHRLLDEPNWGLLAEFNQLPVPTLRTLLQYLDLALPEVSPEGKLSGVLSYTPRRGFQGILHMPEVRLPTSSQPLHLRSASLQLDGKKLRLRPCKLDLPDGRVLELEGGYSPDETFFVWRTVGSAVAVQDTVSAQDRLLKGTPLPWLLRSSLGDWEGSLRYESRLEGPGAWNGRFTLHNARVTVAGLSAPVEISSAAGTIRNNRLLLRNIVGAAGATAFEGSFLESSNPGQPDRLVLHARQMDAAVWKQWLLPAKGDLAGNLLRSLRLRRPAAPAGLHSRNLLSEFRVDSLWLGPTWLGAIRGRAHWRGARIGVDGLEWEHDGVSGTGRAEVILEGQGPFLRLSGDWTNLAWAGGVVSGRYTLETNGAPDQLWRDARLSGAFLARDFTLGDYDVAEATGHFELTLARSGPALKLTSIEVTLGDETYSGQGASDGAGRLAIELEGGEKRLRVAGSIWPLKIEQVALR